MKKASSREWLEGYFAGGLSLSTTKSCITRNKTCKNVTQSKWHCISSLSFRWKRCDIPIISESACLRCYFKSHLKSVQLLVNLRNSLPWMEDPKNQGIFVDSSSSSLFLFTFSFSWSSRKWLLSWCWRGCRVFTSSDEGSSTFYVMMARRMMWREDHFDIASSWLVSYTRSCEEREDWDNEKWNSRARSRKGWFNWSVDDVIITRRCSSTLSWLSISYQCFPWSTERILLSKVVKRLARSITRHDDHHQLLWRQYHQWHLRRVSLFACF
jgi:hypothetical protein